MNESELPSAVMQSVSFSGAFRAHPQSVWIADLLFERRNRSVKYVEDGNLLILAEMVEWPDLWPRLFNNLGYLVAFAVSVVFNFMLLLMSLSKSRRTFHKKVQCLIANLAFSNIVLSSGFLIYTFLIDVYYDVDSFDTLIELNEEDVFSSLCPFAKQLIHHEMVENFAFAQSLILLMICVDRYCSLFPNYSPFITQSCAFCAVSIVPYVLAMLIVDYQLLSTQIGETPAGIVRLLAISLPTPLSMVFISCAVARLMQMPSIERSAQEDLSCSLSFLFVLTLQFVEKFGFVLELLRSNFKFEIVTGSKEGDEVLHEVLKSFYAVSHYLFLFSPLYSVICILFFVRTYRQHMVDACARIPQLICFRRRTKVDYSSETMRSILAEQARSRHYRQGWYR